jgi:hypothetical protein
VVDAAKPKTRVPVVDGEQLIPDTLAIIPNGQRRCAAGYERIDAAIHMRGFLPACNIFLS